MPWKVKRRCCEVAPALNIPPVKRYFPKNTCIFKKNEYFYYSILKTLLETLITSKTRIKLLLKFFLNDSYSSYLRQLETEFDESSNAIRVELNRFEDAGLLRSYTQGNRKYYQAENTHPLYEDIHNIILKYVGIDQVIEHVAHKLGDLDRVFLRGDFAEGRDNSTIDFIFVGEKLDGDYLLRLVHKAESLIKRKVQYLVMDEKEFSSYATINGEKGVLLLWKA
jgi:DNA-binding transcriptional ArsR family regulator